MNKTIQRKVALMLIVLILSMPFYFSLSFAEITSLNTIGIDKDKYDKDFKFINVDESNVTPAYKKCTSKAKDADNLVEKLDSGIIKSLESAAAVSALICTTIQAIRGIVGTFVAFIGADEGGCCKLLGFGCGSIDAEVISINKMTRISLLDKFCNFVTGGWCAFMDSGGGFMSKLANSGFVADQYNNLLGAVACMNIPAILYNVRKVKTINQVYSCCVKQACNYGRSTIACDRYRDEAMCMAMGGGMITTIFSMVMNWVINKILSDTISNVLKESAFLNCILGIYDLATVPDKINSVIDKYQWVSKTFSEPDCEDLGFEVFSKDYDWGSYSRDLNRITDIQDKINYINSPNYQNFVFQGGSNSQERYLRNVLLVKDKLKQDKSSARLHQITSQLIGTIGNQITRITCEQQWKSSDIEKEDDVEINSNLVQKSSSANQPSAFTDADCTTDVATATCNIDASKTVISPSKQYDIHYNIYVKNCDSLKKHFNVKLSGEYCSASCKEISVEPLTNQEVDPGKALSYSLSYSEVRGNYTKCEVIMLD